MAVVVVGAQGRGAVVELASVARRLTIAIVLGSSEAVGSGHSKRMREQFGSSLGKQKLGRKTWKVALVLVIAVLAVASTGIALVLSESKVEPEAIRSSVIRLEDAIQRAWALPVAASFKQELSWQSNPSLCGPASLANVFRSLGEPATSEKAVLAGTDLCWTGFCIFGLTLDELAGLARTKSGRNVTVFRNLSAEEFREHLKRSNHPSRRYIVNFSRKAIFGAGAGHHSPIGGYLEREDLVFVLDVNREYQPWLVERTRLFEAVDTWDGDKKRGILMIE